MDRKFVRFLIVFSSILIICGFAFLYGFRILEEPDVSDYVSGFSIGTISLIGQLFFFIAYDLIGDESWWRKVIKVFFLILAWIIIIASSVLALFIFLADLEYNLFPWEGAVIAQWISCGLLSYAIYRSIEREENTFMSAFAPYISMVISYLVNALIIYLLSLLYSVLKINAVIIILYLILVVLYCLLIFKDWSRRVLTEIMEDMARNKIERPKYEKIPESSPETVKKTTRTWKNQKEFTQKLDAELRDALKEFIDDKYYKGRYGDDCSGANAKWSHSCVVNVSIDRNEDLSVIITNGIIEIEYGYYYRDKDYNSTVLSFLERFLEGVISSFVEENTDLYEIREKSLYLKIDFTKIIDENRRWLG